MAKAFEIVTPHSVEEFRKTDYTFALDYAMRVFDANLEAQYTFKMSGKVCSLQEFIDACRDIQAEKIAKKNETHQKISVQRGASCFGRETIWVRR